MDCLEVGATGPTIFASDLGANFAEELKKRVGVRLISEREKRIGAHHEAIKAVYETDHGWIVEWFGLCLAGETKRTEFRRKIYFDDNLKEAVGEFLEEKRVCPDGIEEP